MQWFKDSYLNDLREGKILDVGSYNVNGCYKEIFEENRFDYRGLDMESGPNVDIVPSKTYDWQEIENDQFDVVVSGQALEHIEFFWVTFAEIIRVTKEGGLICIIAPNGFKEHRYPVDCWRFFTDGMISLARYFELELIHAHTNCAPSVKDKSWFSEDCADSMLIAKKNYRGKARIVNLQDYKCKPLEHEGVSGGMKNFEEYEKYEKSRDEVEKERESYARKHSKSLLKKITAKLMKYIKER